MKLSIILSLLSFSLFAKEIDYKELTDQLLTHKLKQDLEFNWTDSLLTLSIIRSRNNLDIRDNLLKKVKDFYRKNENSPVNITSPDLLASVMGAIEFENIDHKFKKTVQAGYRFLISEPRNELGALNHIGSRHRFSPLLPLTSSFIDDSIWTDSTVMYVLPAMMIAKKFKDKKLLKFTRKQLDIFEQYLDQGLYKHAYYLEDKITYPEGEFYWLRGNAWIFLSLIELYELETDERIKEKYQRKFVELYNEIIKYQKDNGLFNTLLTHSDVYNYEDTAGNAIIFYSLLKADRLGLMNTKNTTKKMYSSMMKKVNTHNNDRASLEGISSPTNAFKYYWYYTWIVGKDNDLGYGLGPFILALNELVLRDQ